MTIRAIALLVALAALPATTARSQDKAHTAPASQPAADANVFLIRAYAEPTLFPATVKIDGRAVASLSQRDFTAVKLEAGAHRLKLGWPLLATQSNAEVSILIEPEKTYYFLVLGQAGPGRAETDITYIRSGSGFAALPAYHGPAMIEACCVFKPPR
ncbi:hypothetical protein AS593_20220 [Caulobacter vibrioides]|nr:hypothetical protein AS593_20220 [Caulobacter vibrioides]